MALLDKLSSLLYSRGDTFGKKARRHILCENRRKNTKVNSHNIINQSESARPSFEKMFSCKAFAGMTLNSEDLTFFLPLNLTSLVMSSGAEV